MRWTPPTLLAAAALGALAALPAPGNPPCVTFAPSYPPPLVYSAPTYSAPVYHEKVIVKEVPFAVPTPYAYFAFVAQPTTPPPVVVAAPAPPPPSPLPVTAPCQAGCPVAPVAPPPAVVPSGGAGVAPGSEDRLARVEALLVRLAERQLAVPADAAPVAREAPVATPPAPAPPAYDANAALVLNDLRAKGTQVQTNYPGTLGPAVTVLAARGCAQCHSGPDSREGIVLWNAQGQWAPSVTWQEIYNAVRPRRGKDGQAKPPKMPKGSPAVLTPEEVAVVKRMKEESAKGDED
jgi:hypothetical protein